MAHHVAIRYQKAYDTGAHAKRGGIPLQRAHLLVEDLIERSWLQFGWLDQQHNPGAKVNYHFRLNRGKGTSIVPRPRNLKGTIMRNEEELQKLRDEYSGVYDPYAESEKAAGREPVPFDEAFASHLEALDAEAATATEAPVTEAKGKKAAAPKAPKAPKEPKAPKAPKAKAFRPTSEDRLALNAAAADALSKAKAEGTARMKPEAGGTYSDFLSGKTLTLDDKGNGSTTLNVVTAKEADKVVGKVVVTVKANVMTAAGKKA